METKKCPYCGEEILAVAKKCKHCGEWLKEEETPKPQVACPVCSELIDEQTLICPHCHENVKKWDAKPKVQMPVQEKPHIQPPKANNVVPTKDVAEEVEYEEEKQASRFLRIRDKEDGSPAFFNYYCNDVFGGQYADFKGKMSRKRYWIFAVTVIILSYFFMGMMSLNSTDVKSNLICTLFWGLIMLLPTLSAGVRRLHDIGKSGWWLLIGIVPIVGQIWVIVLLCKKGKLRSKKVPATAGDKITIVVGILLSLGLYVYGVMNSMKAVENEYANYLTERVLEDLETEEAGYSDYATIQYNTYVNSKFNYSINYPANLIAQGKTKIVDGQIFQSDNALLTVWRDFIVDDNGEWIEDIKDAYKRAIEEYEAAGMEIKYKTQKRNFFVISVSHDDQISYRKTISQGSGIYVTGEFTYWQSDKEYFDNIVSNIFNSFKFN